ncbi:MAG: hypothetical protein KI790_09810 [Cyclobacteriaceae bacterium]|nr:hypothetical protein [Cyclobacteriaceae bacterium HetDA_MAG_MS6]
MLWNRILGYCLVLLWALHGNAQQEFIDQFEKRKYVTDSGSFYYAVFAPKELQPEKRYPLILSWHGMENQGVFPEDFMKNAASIVWGWVRPEVQDNYPCYVLAPHFTVMPDDAIVGGAHFMDIPAHLIDSLVGRGQVDPNRIYVTGHSMGGGFAWASPMRMSTRFAAMMPTSYLHFQEQQTEEAIAIYATIPLWPIHHNQDGNGPEDEIEFLNSTGLPFISTHYFDGEEKHLSETRKQNLIDAHHQYFYTEYNYPCGEKVNCHFAMDTAVVDPYIHQWLFQQYLIDPEALSMALQVKDNGLQITWQASVTTDSVEVWVQDGVESLWVRAGKTIAIGGEFMYYPESILDSANFTIRLLLYNQEGFVYGVQQQHPSDFPEVIADNPHSKSAAVLHPIPSRGTIKIAASDDIVQREWWYQLIDVNGKTIDAGQTIQQTIDISDIANGVYFLRAHRGYEQLFERIIVSQ